MNKKGISLIVLVITIIVMALLAGATIMTLENTGIVGKSKQATKQSSYSDEMTRLTVIKNGILTDNLGKITLDEYIEVLENKGIIDSSIVTNVDGSKTFTTNAGVKVTVSQNGKSDLLIEFDEKQSSNVKTKIKFYIDGTEFQADDGMTWGEWVNSSYNNGDYFNMGGNIATATGINVINGIASNKIVNGQNYSLDYSSIK